MASDVACGSEMAPRRAPRGHDAARGPALAITRPSGSVTARTSEEMRAASFSPSCCTVARSSSADVSAECRSVSHVSSAALSVGFSARVATVARASFCRRASTLENISCADARLSATDRRTRLRTSMLMTTSTVPRTSATVKNDATTARVTSFGGGAEGRSVTRSSREPAA